MSELVAARMAADSSAAAESDSPKQTGHDAAENLLRGGWGVKRPQWYAPPFGYRGLGAGPQERKLTNLSVVINKLHSYSRSITSQACHPQSRQEIFIRCGAPQAHDDSFENKMGRRSTQAAHADKKSGPL